MHRNFRSNNVLLKDNLEVCISDCGLGPLLSSGSTGQVTLLISESVNSQLIFIECFLGFLTM